MYLINTRFHVKSGIRHRKRTALANYWIRVSFGAAHQGQIYHHRHDPNEDVPVPGMIQ